MATSSNSPTPSDRESQADSPGLTTGTGPDLSGTAAPAKPAVKPRSRAKGAQPGAGGAADGGAGEGLTGAKPVSKAKGKAGAEGKASSGKGRTSTAAAAQPAAPGTTPSGDVSSGGGAGSGAGAESIAARGEPQGQRMSDEERQRRIAEAAYRKAQERGFGGDRHIDDWLEAEREFDQGGGHGR